MSLDWLSERDREILESVHKLIELSATPTDKEKSQDKSLLHLKGEIIGLKVYVWLAWEMVIKQSASPETLRNTITAGGEEAVSGLRKSIVEHDADYEVKHLLLGVVDSFETLTKLLTHKSSKPSTEEVD